MASAGATLEQEPEGDGSCRLRCSSSKGAWQVRLCAAELGDLRVVSGDCEWLAVLRREPAIEDSISATAIGALFRRGVPARLILSGELPSGAVSILANRLVWLGEGAAQFRDGSLLLPLRTGPDARLQLAAPAPRMPAPAAGQVRYVDEQGTLHLVDSRDEVPERYRAGATPVSPNAVTVLHMPPPPAVEPEPVEQAPQRSRRASPPPARAPRPGHGQAPYGLTWLEWVRVLSGQRGLGDPGRPACIGNDGKPKQCNE
ncbi:MAG TPA: hypothetical protein VI356_00490 [Myxococcales bacterium]